MKQNIILFLVTSLFFYTEIFAQNSKIKVACIGNSVTYGYGLKDPFTESYPVQLQKMLGEKYEVKNFGHSGATLLRKGHNPYFKTKEFNEAIQLKADIAIIHLGLNDTDPRDWNNYSSDFRDDYSWLIDTLRKANPDVKVYICLMTPIFNDHPRFRSGTRDWYWKIQNLIPEIAKVNHTTLIDLHTAFYSHPNLFPDALHPNKAGAVILAKTVYSAISGDYEGLQMSSVFANDMVLQRDKPIPIFGTANANEEITVSFLGTSLSDNKHLPGQSNWAGTKKTKSDSDGRWKVVFDPLPAGGPYTLIVKSGDKKIGLHNILLGDVWLCSGQSNMLFRLNQSYEGKQAIESSANKNIRLFQLNAIRETDDVAWDSSVLDKVNKLEYFTGNWQQCNPQTASTFSAIGYFFGKKIQQEENVPIGLIEVAVGGAPIVSFIDRHTMEFDNYLVDELCNWRKSDFIMPWVRERASKNLENSKDPRQRHPYEPCYNYEAGISKFINTPIKGILWYQGESDAHNVDLYAYNFKQLISSWRNLWNQNLPFYFVQLSSIDRPSWPYFRDMQRRMSLEIPNTFMAVSSDYGDSLNVHPTHKQPIGERLALLALKNSYHKNIVATAPTVQNAFQNGKEIVVNFSNATKLKTRNNEPLTGFEVMNEKGDIFSPKAEIKDNKVILFLNKNEKIIKVLYAFKPFTKANLENEVGLPAGTFSVELNKVDKSVSNNFRPTK
ncbi:MAG TPA: GDSL-type esterase/lipase family protein [Hanamia sp.]|nr:GDSL-type esterase/lipase family protein [Hanamia sp.]